MNSYFRGLLAGVIGTFIGLGIPAILDTRALKEQAVQTEYARYNPDTGDFEWVVKDE